jgi:glutamate-5-semialdehyde dehydrogenase
MNQLKAEILEICQKAKESVKSMALLDEKTKNNILLEVKNLIISNQEKILEANAIDVKNAQKNQLESSKIDRLILNQDKILAMAKSIDEIVKLPDPVGKIIFETNRPNGLNIKRISTPIGVLLTIYEARPNGTLDVAGLSIKSGNVAILRSGSEALNSSKILASFFQEALKKFNVNENAITFCKNPPRDLVKGLLKMDKFIDVVIPRGGKSMMPASAPKLS